MDLQACKSLQEVRKNIDRLDEQIMDLLYQRAFYVRNVLAFKASCDEIVVPERIEEIVQKARHFFSNKEDTDDQLGEDLYRNIIDSYIAYEKRCWKRQK